MRLALLGLTLIAMFSSPAFAHPGLDHVHSLESGVLHPLSGADHVFVMASVGLWAALVGGRAIWVWPLAFIAAMLAGFAAARLGLQISFVEPAISISVVVLGLLIAVGIETPLALGAAIVGLFAFFHGHAHGTEAAGAGIFSYAAGFTLSTAVLHAAGVGLGLGARSLVERITGVPARRMRSAAGGGGGLQ
jgi:urease accessory protein